MKKISRDFIDFYPGTTFFYSGKEHKGISVCLYFDNKINDFKKTLIPSKYLIKRASIFYDKNYILNNDLKLRTSIIEILKSFLDKRDKDMIPYVFGGTSIGRYFNEDDLIKKELMINGKKKNFYAPIKDETPIIGPDCSGLVGLISRMVGVPMVFRNSSVQEMFLSEVENEILDGDILWINGHVIILNPSENRCIECAGYESGFKGLRENEISERIKDISNFKNLMKANNEKRAISLINTNGEIKEKKIWKLLSLTSCLKFDFFIDSIFFNYAQ